MDDKNYSWDTARHAMWFLINCEIRLAIAPIPTLLFFLFGVFSQPKTSTSLQRVDYYKTERVVGERVLAGN